MHVLHLDFQICVLSSDVCGIFKILPEALYFGEGQNSDVI